MQQAVFGLLFSFLFPSFAGADPACSSGTFELPAPGEIVERSIRGRDVHCYRVPPGHEDRLVVVVQQRAVADVRIESSTGLKLDSPLHYSGDEVWFSAADAGARFLMVTTTAPAGVNEAYIVRSFPIGNDEVAIARDSGMLLAQAMDVANRGEMARDFLSLSLQWQKHGRLHWAALSAHLAGFLWWHDGATKDGADALIRARDLFERAGDQASEAKVVNHRAMLLLDQAKFDAALGQLESALQLQKAAGDEHGLPTTLNNQGLVHHYRGDLEPARRLYEQAAKLNDALGRPHEKLAQLNNLGGIHYVRGDAAAALEAFREVARISEASGMSHGLAAALGNLALVQSDAGAYFDALSTYTELLARCRQENDDTCAARTLDRMGWVYLNLGDVTRAISYMEQARDMRRALDDKRTLAHTLRALGHAYRLQGRLDAAKAAVKEGLMFAKTPGDRGRLHLVLARVLFADGQFDLALTEFDRARRQFEAGEEPHRSAVARIGIADTRLASGAGVEAVRLSALDPVLRDAGQLDARIELRRVLAEWFMEQGAPDEALREIESARALVDEARESIPLPALGAGYGGSHGRVLDLEVELLMRLHERHPDGGYALRALAASERARSKTFSEMLRQHEVRPAGEGGELAARRDHLLEQINFAVSRQSADAGREIGARLAEWRSELDVIENALAGKVPVYSAIMRGADEVAVEQVQQWLNDESALIHFHLAPERGFAWVVTRHDVHVLAIPGEKVLAPRVEAARSAVQRRSVPRADRAEALAALYAAVVAPLEEVAAAYPRWILVPDRPLHVAPFAALSPAGAAPLAAQRVLQLLPSIQVGLKLAARRDATESTALALVSDPVYDATDSRIAADNAMHAQVRDVGRLRGSRHEAGAIASLDPARTVHHVTGFEARPAVLHEARLADAGIVHFAVHGVFDSKAPALSGLLLSRFTEKGDAVNGFVGLRDIYALEWDARLVVLSGCETALGGQYDSEGLVGLTSGFLAAGADEVVSSLWRIPDAATAAFMANFHRHLPDSDASSALRQAQLDMMNSRRWQHPYFWSGFVTHGVASRHGSSPAVATASQ